MGKVIKMHVNRKTPDYGRDLKQSRRLAREIEAFWHTKGYDWVRVYVQTMTGIDGSKEHIIRSNITFKVPNTKE